MSMSLDKSVSLDTDTLEEQFVKWSTCKYAGEEKIITGDQMSFQ